MIKYLIIFIISISILTFSLYYYVNYQLDTKVVFSDSLTVEIPLNTSNAKIIEKFNEKGALKPTWLYDYIFKVYSRYNKKYVYAGYYRFPPEISNREIINKLYEGTKPRTVKVTFPEGLSIEDMADLLEPVNSNPNRFVELAYSDSLLKARKIESGSLLGYLMPDTYEFFLYERPEAIIDKLLNAGENHWKSIKAKKTSKLSKHEVLTLASIVEAETPLKSEAPIVAGLYLNRLNIGMLLQADPTVQYVLGKKRRVLYKDLETDNPYNTYVYGGLPPGPINNPGKKAIEAVLNPANHDYLFMVSKGDGSGEHYFSEDNKSHLMYVNRYRKTRDSLKSIN